MSLNEIDDLIKDLSQIDSAAMPDFEEQVMQGIAAREVERQQLKKAFVNSFQTTFAGLTMMILLLGPSSIVSKVSNRLYPQSPMVLADNFQTENIITERTSTSSKRARDEVPVLIELVDGATKQKEYVSGVLRVNSKSPSKASLILPNYEATVLKEFERKTAL